MFTCWRGSLSGRKVPAAVLVGGRAESLLFCHSFGLPVARVSVIMARVTRLVLLSGAASPNTRLQRTRPAVRSQGVRTRPVCRPVR